MAYESTHPGVANPGASSEPTASAPGSSSAGKAERARRRAAAGLEGAAQSVHAGVERAAGAGHSAGNALSSGAQYLREHDAGAMMEDVMDVIRNNPGVAILGAAALGFLVGRLLTRD